MLGRSMVLLLFLTSCLWRLDLISICRSCLLSESPRANGIRFSRAVPSHLMLLVCLERNLDPGSAHVCVPSSFKVNCIRWAHDGSAVAGEGHCRPCIADLAN